jgi:hypothetical protein
MVGCEEGRLIDGIRIELAGFSLAVNLCGRNDPVNDAVQSVNRPDLRSPEQCSVTVHTPIE